MPREQIVMGALIALMSVIGLASEKWLLSRTRNGRALVRWFGESQGLWVLRLILAAFAVLGVLLAFDIVRPIRW